MGTAFTRTTMRRLPRRPTSRRRPRREHAGWLEERLGSVPLTLLSWVRLVGDVWLVGTHPQWATSASADPLVIGAVRRRDDDALRVVPQLGLPQRRVPLAHGL